MLNSLPALNKSVFHDSGNFAADFGPAVGGNTAGCNHLLNKWLCSNPVGANLWPLPFLPGNGTRHSHEHEDQQRFPIQQFFKHSASHDGNQVIWRPQVGDKWA